LAALGRGIRLDGRRFLRQSGDRKDQGAGEEKSRNPYDHFNLSSSDTPIIVGEILEKLKCLRGEESSGQWRAAFLINQEDTSSVGSINWPL
jgi:hypothetical protein